MLASRIDRFRLFANFASDIIQTCSSPSLAQVLLLCHLMPRWQITAAEVIGNAFATSACEIGAFFATMKYQEMLPSSQFSADENLSRSYGRMENALSAEDRAVAATATGARCCWRS